MSKDVSEKAKEKNYVGRPSKYKKRYCKEIVDFMSKGKSLAAFMGNIGVNEYVLHRWRDKHKEFNNACLIAMQKNEQWFEEIMLAHITGAHKSPAANSNGKYLQHGNSGLLRWAMSHRFKTYREKVVEEPVDKDKEIVYRSYVDEAGMIVTEREEISLDPEEDWL